MVAHTVIPALGRLRQEDHKFKVSLGYTVNSSPAWAIYGDPVTKQNKQNKHPE
jgi:hypothetical protein